MFGKTEEKHHKGLFINFNIFVSGSACLGSNPGRTTGEKEQEICSFFLYCMSLIQMCLHCFSVIYDVLFCKIYLVDWKICCTFAVGIREVENAQKTLFFAI